MLLYTGLAVSLLLAGWAALAAAEARWQLALNATGEGVWDYSFRTGMDTLSPSAQGIVDAPGTLLPFDRGAFVAMAHPEDSAALLQALDAHLKGLTPGYTAQFRTRLGTRPSCSGAAAWLHSRGRRSWPHRACCSGSP